MHDDRQRFFGFEGRSGFAEVSANFQADSLCSLCIFLLPPNPVEFQVDRPVTFTSRAGGLQVRNALLVLQGDQKGALSTFEHSCHCGFHSS